MQVAGVFLLSLAHASVNLRVLAGSQWEEIIRETEGGSWYPRSLFDDALAAVARRFRDPAPILEELGFEMMRLWYENGPGRTLVDSGVAFLRHQVSSVGYRSLVQGADEETGNFGLASLDEEKGEARILSTTPFPRALERGVLRGGMLLGGGVDFVEVTSVDGSTFDVVFR